MVKNKVTHIKNLKIPVSDENEAFEMLNFIQLNKFGREILTACKRRKTVQLSRNHPDIDLILMDLLMPEMNGLEATKQIRGCNQDVIIIAQTAYGLAGDREKALEAGCNEYVTKPVKKEELIKTIQKFY